MKNKVLLGLIILLSSNLLLALTIPIKTNTVIADQRVNDDNGRYYQYTPSMAINSSGVCVMTWWDYRNDRNDIYAQRFDASGNPLSANFKVNDTDTLLTLSSNASRIGIAEDGSFVIVWAGKNIQDGFNDIYAQRYDTDGNALGAITMINVHRENNNSDYPDIAMMENGNYVVVWQKNDDIYAKLFNASGVAVSEIILVNDDTEYELQRRPVVGISENGSFTVAWYDRRDRTSDIKNYDIYAQRFDSTGNKLGSNFKVNDEESSEYRQIDPSIAVDSTGNLLITWQDYRNDPSDIFAQRYDNDGNRIGTNFIVTDDGGSSGQASPSVSMTNDGICAVAWLDARDGYYDIYAQLYEFSNKLGNNFAVPISNSGINPHNRLSVKIQDSKIYTVWSENRFSENYYDIFYNVLEFSKEYVDTKSISNITTNSALATGGLYREDLLTQHGFWWTISGDPSYEKNMLSLGVADTIGFFSSTISGLHPNTEYDLRAFAANALGEFKYGEVLSFRTLGLPRVSDISLVENNVGLQLQANITDLGYPNPTQHGFCWNTTGDSTSIDEQIILGPVDSTGIFTWAIENLWDNTHYYVRAFATNIVGTAYSNVIDFTGFETLELPTISNLNLNEDVENCLQLQANITNLGNPNPTQHGFCLNTTGDPTRADIQVRLGSINSTGGFSWTIGGLLNNTHYYARAFVTNSAGTVYSNTVSFTFIETSVEKLPTEFVLHPNFPNPFNPTTTISYQLPTDSDVELSILDMNGKIIKTLIKANISSGYYAINWDASGLSSGIYFYRLIAGNFIKTKKMVLMK